MTIRANTHREPPPLWSQSSAPDYRTYNDLQLEPWLARAYSETVEPFFLAPDAAYVKHIDEKAAAIRQDSADALRVAVNETLSVINSNPEEHERVLRPWHEATPRQREDWCLSVWQAEQEERAGLEESVGRAEAPELTLSWARDRYALDRLISNLVFDPTVQPYHHVGHAAFDRLNLPPPSSVPPSRFARFFAEDAKVYRTTYLVHFCMRLLQILINLVSQDDNDSPSVTTVDAKDAAPNKKKDQSKSQDKPAPNYCSNCGEDENKDRALTCCGKCFKQVRRRVWYCNADCQRSHWPQHRVSCGKTLRDAEDSAPSALLSSNQPTANQLSHLRWLDACTPRAIWGVQITTTGHAVWNAEVQPVSTTSAPVRDRMTVLFKLEPFVRPFVPCLHALRALRNRATLGLSEIDVGALAYYIQLRAQVLDAPHKDPFIPLLSQLLELDEAEVRRDAQVVRERIEGGTGEVDGLDKYVVAALRQLKSGTADLSYPAQNLRPAAYPFLDGLLLHPTAFYFFKVPEWSTIPERRGLLAPLLVFEDTPSYTRMHAILRRIAFSVLTSRGRDRTELGMLALFAAAWLRAKPAPSASAAPSAMVGQDDEAAAGAAVRRWTTLADELEKVLGLAGGTVEKAYRWAEVMAGEREGEDEGEVSEDRALLQAAYRHFRETPNPLLSEMGLDGGATAGQKRRNRKKKKKGGKKTSEETEAVE
ncbi:hypothetical protein JCM8097_006256 [Rhodosporidiobolus ruineniae]